MQSGKSAVKASHIDFGTKNPQKRSRETPRCLNDSDLQTKWGDMPFGYSGIRLSQERQVSVWAGGWVTTKTITLKKLWWQFHNNNSIHIIHIARRSREL